MTDLAYSIIQLDARIAVCHVCEAESPPHWGIPIFEGMVLPNDWTGDWGGVDACTQCWTRQGALTAPMTLQAFRREGIRP